MSAQDYLLKVKKEIEEGKAKKNRLQGRVDERYDQLKNQFDCKTKAQANKKLKFIAGNIEDWEDELADRIEDLKKDFNWD